MKDQPTDRRIRIAVVFCCHDGRGNVLLARRGPKARNGHGQWDIGGGEVDYAEPVEMAARREIREEYGVDRVQLEPMGYREVFQFEERGCHWIAFDFAALVDPSRVSNPEGPEKFSEMRWFPFGQWPDPLYSKLPEFLKKNDARLREICRPPSDAPPSSWPDDPSLVNAVADLPHGRLGDAMRPPSVPVERPRIVLPPHARPRPEEYGRPTALSRPPLPEWWSATDAWRRAYARVWEDPDALRLRYPGRWVLMDPDGVRGDFATHTEGYRAAFDGGLAVVDIVLFRPDELRLAAFRPFPGPFPASRDFFFGFPCIFSCRCAKALAFFAYLRLPARGTDDGRMVRYRRAVWWVKRDFRLDDNAALLAAAASDRLLAAFIYDPERLHAPETSAVHLEVWRRGGESLARGLRERGGEIAALHGSVPEAFERLRTVYPFDAIVCHADPDGPAGAARDARVADWCLRRGVDFVAIPSVSADDAAWKASSATAPDPLPMRLPDPGIVMLPTWRHWPLPAALGFSDPVPNVDAEPDAVAALERFLSLDGGPASGISGALAWGALGTRRTLRMAQGRLAEWRPSSDPFVCRRADAVRAFIARLHRRERSRRAAMERPERLDRVDGLLGRDEPRAPDPRLLAAWANGETGFPHADAAMRCLRATGLLPFRFRAHLASVATRVLGLPWEQVRPHFARAFADYDPAILSLQLQVRAGLAGGPVPAAPIVPPRDLDPDAAFVKTWIPELRRHAASEIAMHALRPIPEYRRPVVDPRAASARVDAELRRRGVPVRSPERRPRLPARQAALAF